MICDRIGEAGLKAPSGATCGGGDDFDKLGGLSLVLPFSSSIFLPSFQNDRLDVFLPASSALVSGSVPPLRSGSFEDDLEDLVDCGKEPGSSGAIDPRDSESFNFAATSLSAIDMLVL